MNGFSGSLAQRLAQSLSPAIVGMGAAGARSAARMPPRGRTWAGPCGAHSQPGRGSWGRSAQAWWACVADIDGRLVFHKRPCFLGVLHDQTPRVRTSNKTSRSKYKYRLRLSCLKPAQTRKKPRTSLRSPGTSTAAPSFAAAAALWVTRAHRSGSGGTYGPAGFRRPVSTGPTTYDDDEAAGNP